MPESDPLLNDYGDIENSKEKGDFCHETCQQYFFTWLACTILLLVLVAILVFVLELEAVALIVGSIVPASVILFLAKKKFHEHVLLGQMIVTFFEAILWMLPLLILDSLGVSLVSLVFPPSDGKVTWLSVLQVLFISLFFAGFCEEFLKYVVIARIQKSPLISSWKSLLVYGISAGAGFATAENLSYVLRSDFSTAIVRAFLSVPLHCLTGSIIGMMIGLQRFFGADVVTFWKSKYFKYLFVYFLLIFTSYFIFNPNLSHNRPVGDSWRIRYFVNGRCSMVQEPIVDSRICFCSYNLRVWCGIYSIPVY